MTMALLAVALFLNGNIVDMRPPLEDALRLPSLGTLQEWQRWNINYRDHVSDEMQRCRDANGMVLRSHEAAYQEAIAIGHWLELAISARNDRPGYQQCEEIRRDYLHQLRDRMGWGNYYAGHWPPSIPWWRLSR